MLEDPYEILGVERDAGDAELRRAFRKLALKFHPDRVGPKFTVVFQDISRAYETLSNPSSRAAWDRKNPSRNSVRSAPPSAPAKPVKRKAMIDRLSGPIEGLLRTGVVREVEGLLELLASASERAEGGWAIIAMNALVSCRSCHGAGCDRCGQSGVVDHRCSVWVPIDAGAEEGTEISVAVDPDGKTAPVRVRLARR